MYDWTLEIYVNTRTPAAMDAMVFLLSPQSTLHSQSPQRIPSINPDMTLGKCPQKHKSTNQYSVTCEGTRVSSHNEQVKVGAMESDELRRRSRDDAKSFARERQQALL